MMLLSTFPVLDSSSIRVLPQAETSDGKGGTVEHSLCLHGQL